MTTDPFQDALDYLYSFVSFERQAKWNYNNKSFNLQRYTQFLHHLGQPQNPLQPIHVAGSDGKGSVCTILSHVLHRMGYRVGTYLSPHLEDIRERIRINGEWIPQADFIFWTNFLKEKANELPPLPDGYATFFELMTAMAFLHLRQQNVDFAVIETGLGGRLDATNVMQPLITVITHISMEHTMQLGNTLQQIADEKLGISRPGVPVVIGNQEPELLPHFQSRLENHTAPVIFTDRDYTITHHTAQNFSRTLQVQRKQDKQLRNIQLPLLGQYQIQNALTALAVLDHLQQTNHIPPIPGKELNQHFHQLKWDGRFEIRFRHNHPWLLLDVAHTLKGAQALRASLDELFTDQQRVFVLGCLHGKNIRAIVRALVRPADKIILTQAPTPRGLSIPEMTQHLDDLLAPNQLTAKIASPKAAFDYAKSLLQTNHLLIVTGSIYLVGEIRKTLKED
ncbi:hypothetical protein GF373_11850 [bacterium]|nr:hypothetical protein [bacterium]